VADVGVDWIALFVPTSDTHLRHKLRLSEEEAVRRVQWCIRYARDKGLIPLLGLEDGTRTPLDRLRRVVDAAQEAGVSSLELSDTVGVLTPSATQRCIEWMRPLVDCTLRVHFHNDLGMATANTLTALEAGADGAHVTLAGLGERAGNTPLEEVAVALAVRYGADTKIRLDRLVPAATLVAKYAGVDLGRQRPIVGADVFSHESGIHVAGLLAEPSTYEPFPPSLLGREHHIVFGKHSGITGLRHVLAPTGYTLSEEAERALLNRLKTDATRYKRPISSEEVVRLARDMASNRDS
jgi:isopropylmalate/homocitrate/citramalate synthase